LTFIMLPSTGVSKVFKKLGFEFIKFQEPYLSHLEQHQITIHQFMSYQLIYKKGRDILSKDLLFPIPINYYKTIDSLTAKIKLTPNTIL